MSSKYEPFYLNAQVNNRATFLTHVLMILAGTQEKMLFALDKLERLGSDCTYVQCDPSLPSLYLESMDPEGFKEKHWFCSRRSCMGYSEGPLFARVVRAFSYANACY